jgi:hypothetical protein
MLPDVTNCVKTVIFRYGLAALICVTMRVSVHLTKLITNGPAQKGCTMMQSPRSPQGSRWRRWLQPTAVALGGLGLALCTALPAAAASGPAASSAASIAAQVRAGNMAVKPLAEQAGWTYKTYTASLCAFGNVYWGAPHNNANCALGSTELTGEVAYNGHQVWGQWVSVFIHTAPTFSAHWTWKGFVNNGAVYPHYMQLGMNGTSSQAIFGSGSYYMRIDVWTNGGATAYGGAG